MIGLVDEYGRALLAVQIRLSNDAQLSTAEVWVDTGFNGDLVLPREHIESLNLPRSGAVKAILADGSEVTLQTHSCIIEWFGADRHLEVVANDGEYPLLGVGLLLGHELIVNYRTCKLELI